jgi:N4-gp56 family major capsid protein
MAFERVTLTTTHAGPSGLLRNYWKGVLEEKLRNELLAADLCEKETIPANSGTNIEFHRINAFPKQLTGISQFLGYATVGDLKGQSFSVDSIVYPLSFIGNDLRLSEQTIMTVEPNVIPELTDEFMYNAADSLDQYMINIMVSNSGTTNSATVPSVSYMGASTSVSVTWGDGSQTLTEATLDADNPSHRVAAESFNSLYTGLRSRSAKPPSGRRSFPCLISPEIGGDLRTDGTFQDIALKGNLRGEDKFERALIGNVFNIDVMESENVSVNFPGTVDTSDQIVRCPVIGRGYVKRISHAKGIGVPRVNFIPPSQADKNDPYGVVGIMVWKMYVANGGVCNPLAGAILKVATTRTKNTVQEDDGQFE